MGFLREINKKVGTPVDGLPDVKKNVGLRYKLAGLFDGDLEDLTEILLAANKGLSPRLSVENLDYYIDNECEDVEALFAEVIDFLKSVNACKKTMNELQEMADRERAKKTQN
jgi:hypothetical protein